ncbi:SCO family protein [Aequorivita sp. H23M31]|uniref:SCO family protein n=1 Tax=Aequorivita ciconiae TaxID=2494375 RepID=A0A410G1X7_9FLAO|nr:SCO family protein [Aequorivita sp. H23M31]QAA81239.1 SCO family protein [Aequorivita sp. H23M31]
MNYIKYFFLVLVIGMSSCKNNSEDKNEFATDIENIEIDNEISDMSVFNLPSHWTTQDGNDIELKDLQGKVLVMVMIYTSCKAACPRLVADMRNIEKQIPENKKNDVQYVFVSIDPETDTPERLKEFAKENKMDDDKWLFLRGSEEDTREFAAVLAVSYKEISPIDFSHSNIISVFNQKGELAHQQEGLGVDNVETVQAIKDLAN